MQKNLRIVVLKLVSPGSLPGASPSGGMTGRVGLPGNLSTKCWPDWFSLQFSSSNDSDFQVQKLLVFRVFVSLFLLKLSVEAPIFSYKVGANLPFSSKGP